MNCNHLREQLVDLATGTPASAELEQHLHSCSECAEVLAGLRQTLSLMDDWQAPEPSAYFDVRMQARLREEKSRSHSFFEWLRKPALGLAAAVLFVAGIGLFQYGDSLKSNNVPNAAQNGGQKIVATTGTAVADLQYLDKNSDLLTDFDALDALDTSSNSDVN